VQESQLTKLCLAIAILGIAILFLLQYSTRPKSVLISQINRNMLDETITTKGIITNIQQTPGLYIITLTQNSNSIPIIVIKSQEIKFSKEIHVTGTIAVYNNQLEILAKEIKNVS